MFYIPIAANIIPPDGKGKMESMMKPTRRVFFENKSKLSEADKKQLIDDYGCQLYKGHTAVLQKEHIKLTTVPDNATDVDILSLIEVLPSDFLNFITRWR